MWKMVESFYIIPPGLLVDGWVESGGSENYVVVLILRSFKIFLVSVKLTRNRQMFCLLRDEKQSKNTEPFSFCGMEINFP